jgi:hypothetical protein
MKTNELPESVFEQLDAHYGPHIVYSFDVHNETNNAVIAVGWEDPDFPELWVCEEETSKIKKIDDSSVLIDYPMGKAFWAENGKDIIVATNYPEPDFSLLVINEVGLKVIEQAEVENSKYINEKYSSVESLM